MISDRLQAITKGSMFSRRLMLCLILFVVNIASWSSVRAQDVKLDVGVMYGEEGFEQRLDIFQPPRRDTPRAAIILIHGGAGRYGIRSDLYSYGMAFADAGYVVFNIDYRLHTDQDTNRWPAQLDDAQLAVRWIRANASLYNIDPDRICAIGHSFGGQLAALLGTRDAQADTSLVLGEYSSRVACVIDIAGSVDPSQPLRGIGTGEDVRLMGGTLAEMPEAYHDASPLAQVDANSAPFLILHGADDLAVPVEASRLMVDALHTAGVETVYVEYPSVDHFYWIIGGDRWSLVGPISLAFLERHLNPAS
jgi:acetyl esterase/lipase